MRAVFEGLSGDGYLVLVPGMFHADFSDAPFFSPLTRLLGVTGSIDGHRAHVIVNAYSLAFFDRHLKGPHTSLVDGPARNMLKCSSKRIDLSQFATLTISAPFFVAC
jgi:hypothetical protein